MSVVAAPGERAAQSVDRSATGSRSRIAFLAYSIGCLASVVFALGTLLPSYAVDPGGAHMSFYDSAIRFGPSGVVAKAGACLFVYAGPAIVLLLAIVGLAGNGRRSPGSTAFAGASVAWGIVAMGLLLNQASAGGHGLGYLAMVVGACLGIMGGLVEAALPGAATEIPGTLERARSKPASRSAHPARRRHR